MDKPRKILIVDDDADFARTMEFYLKNQGFDMSIATDEESALREAGLGPDLVLLDLKMPGTSGHKICAALKGDLSTASIPVIMLTSQNETMDKVEALNMGMADYICKTVPFEEILARINAALRGKAGGPGATATSDRNRRIEALKGIMRSGGIEVTYEPIVDIHNRGPVGYEALLAGPEGTVLESREALYTTASEAGFIQDLDRLYRKAAFAKASMLAPEHILLVTADQSAVLAGVFKDESFLDDCPLSAGQVCLNLRESDCAGNPRKMDEAVTPARGKGVKLAVSDIKADYSGLKAIEGLKPDFIKIDVGLVRCVDVDQVKKGIVQSIVKLAKNTESELIAEGVEAEYECLALIELGVRYAQGAFFT